MTTEMIETPGIGLAGLLGVAEADASAALDDLVGAALGREVSTESVQLAVAPYDFGSPATGGLMRVRGRDGASPWSLFCKVLQHVRHWPGLQAVPPEFAADFIAEFPWREELNAWSADFADRLPEGLQLPKLHRVIDLGDDRLAVWMEDVQHDPSAWNVSCFTRAARLLGRFAAASTSPELLAACPRPPGFALRMYAERSIPMRGLSPLADESLWSHPRLADHRDLRRTLHQLGRRIPEFLERLDALPQSMPHGDASPQNLLVPLDSPDTFVMIDISFQTPHAVGFDLSQLLVGLVHADLMPAADLPVVADAILPAFLAGLADEGSAIAAAAVTEAFVLTLLLRSGFDSMRYDLVGSQDPAEIATFENRVGLTRFACERAAALLALPS